MGKVWEDPRLVKVGAGVLGERFGFSRISRENGNENGAILSLY